MKGLGGQILFLAASIGLLATPAAANVATSDLNGVWDGTVGTLPVRMCFNGDGYRNHGQYYYRSKLKSIPLIGDDKKPGQLTEGWPNEPKVARWTIERVAGSRATGRWSAGGRTLPIAFSRVSFTTDDEFQGPCGSMTFLQPRLEGVRIARSTTNAKGLAVISWELDTKGRFEGIDVSTFQLRTSDGASQRINKRLREPFEEQYGWKWCLRAAAEHSAFEGSLARSIEPQLVTSRLLSVVSRTESYCGGAHPSMSSVPTLFDRRSGNVVNLYDWFRPDAVVREKVEGYDDTLDGPGPQLLKLVLKHDPRFAPDDDCSESLETTEWWKIELTAKGMSFQPELPHVIQACGDEALVPFAALAPFLNTTGKQEVAAFLAEARKRRPR